MISFGAPRPARRPSLTPMIDVVFLLLVFFMLAARFGQETSLPMSTAGGAVAYDGPPRLVDITEGGVALNGRALPLAALAGALGPLTETPQDIVVLRPAGGVPLQRLIAVSDALRAAGLTRLLVVE